MHICIYIKSHVATQLQIVVVGNKYFVLPVKFCRRINRQETVSGTELFSIAALIHSLVLLCVVFDQRSTAGQTVRSDARDE